MKIRHIIALLFCLAGLVLATGCASTRTENGVTIEQRRSDIPFVPFF